MINYTYELNEEIARWSTEIYLKQNPKLGWWVAFNNPIAGPWKKIVAPTETGSTTEIYRFVREEERPDLILVNDRLKIVLIVEAKDYVDKLIARPQMVKSIRVINSISRILRTSENEHWQPRKDYRIVASFLWMCEKKVKILEENQLVQSSLDSNNSLNINNQLLNIVVYKDQDDNLVNTFIYDEKEYSDLNTPFKK
jgi:hypothetical protein